MKGFIFFIILCSAIASILTWVLLWLNELRSSLRTTVMDWCGSSFLCPISSDMLTSYASARFKTEEIEGSLTPRSSSDKYRWGSPERGGTCARGEPGFFVYV